MTTSNKIGFGATLIVIGVISLLINLGFINLSIWTSLFRLWPLLLVVIGIGLIFKHKPIVGIVGWILFLIIVAVYGYLISNRNLMFGYNFDGKTIQANSVVNIPKSDQTKNGTFRLDAGGAKFNIGSTNSGLIAARINNSTKYHVDYINGKESVDAVFQNKIASVPYNTKSSSFLLNDSIKWDIDLDMGAVKSDLDLRMLDIRKVSLDCGAVTINLKLGNKSDYTEVLVNSGVSTLSISIPKNSGVRLKTEGALNNIDFNSLRLTKYDGYYQTDNYDNSPKKIDIKLSMGLGKVNLSSY